MIVYALPEMTAVAVREIFLEIVAAFSPVVSVVVVVVVVVVAVVFVVFVVVGVV